MAGRRLDRRNGEAQRVLQALGTSAATSSSEFRCNNERAGTGFLIRSWVPEFASTGSEALEWWTRAPAVSRLQVMSMAP